MRLHTGMGEFHRYEVYLDGKLLENCTEANDESGIAFVLDLDAEGREQREHWLGCVVEEYQVVTVSVSRDLATGATREVRKISLTMLCDCPLKTKMLRGRVEFRRRMKTRHEWVSPSKE